MRDTEHARIDKRFKKNLRRWFPNVSVAKATKRINNVLEELMYGFKKR